MNGVNVVHSGHHPIRRIRQLLRPDGRTLHVVASPEDAEKLKNQLLNEGGHDQFDLVLLGSAEHVRIMSLNHFLTYAHPVRLMQYMKSVHITKESAMHSKISTRISMKNLRRFMLNSTVWPRSSPCSPSTAWLSMPISPNLAILLTSVRYLYTAVHEDCIWSKICA